MGMGGILIVLLIVLLLFGGKKLRGLGADLGGAIKGFRNSVREGEEEVNAERKAEQPKPQINENQASGRVIDSEATNSKNEHKV